MSTDGVVAAREFAETSLRSDKNLGNRLQILLDKGPISPELRYW